MNKTQLLSSLESQGFSKNILEAFEKVPREKFIPSDLIDEAYDDIALYLREGSSISQPYTIAFMLNLLNLNPNQKILEIGSGCGYVLALIEEITKRETYGLEIISHLGKKSTQTLSDLKYKSNVLIKDGFPGLKENAPFDRILISAASPEIPEHLFPQLTKNGILVTPHNDSILKITRNKNEITIEEFPGFAFVPLINSPH